ncbi:MFS family permease [Saccharothrix tamanrassetensis]|uniref:MFS family permease n=1 Tax=Saccharothrix tamanrassetensis TaxID=1051531 RepID=A0A841CDH0_9PSEU|nr:MFS transporter [Saccharothrix tamanrassetensis]MBB5954075.1 MFS family permease [Saccharothrix tamanrassetensis]
MGTGFRAAFAVPEFRVLWSAAALSTIGDQLARVALSVLVFQRTGSATWTALTYALTMLPALVSGVLLTGLADRYPRRAVMVAADLVRAVLLAVMALPGVPLPLLAALLVVAQLAEPPFAAAQGALLPTVLGERYEAGQSVHLITHQAGLLLGFAGGGLVVAWLGTSGALAADAATFALSAVLLRSGLAHRPAPGVVKRTHVRIREGASLVCRDGRLRLLVALGWLALFTVVPEGLAAPFSAEVGAGAAGVGVLLAADPAGMVLGTVLLRFLPTTRRVRLLGLSAVATALPLVGYLLAPGLVGAVALLGLSGVFSAYQVTAGATFVRLVPDEQRGQALGFARSGLVATQGIGVAGGGLLATATGSAGTAIAISGLVGTAVALAVAAAWSRVSDTVAGEG